jgi:NhaC family Na+:H+ antiporter
MYAPLGITTMAYLPYCFFNLLDVAVGFLFGIIGFKIARIEPEEADSRGVGGHRVGPSEHEAVVRGG